MYPQRYRTETRQAKTTVPRFYRLTIDPGAALPQSFYLQVATEAFPS
jgi:hypothetical protein